MKREAVSLLEWKKKRDKRELSPEDEEYLLERLLTEVVDLNREVHELRSVISKLLKNLSD